MKKLRSALFFALLIGYSNAAESPFELEIVTRTTTTFYGDVPG